MGELKNRERVNITLDIELAEKLRERSKETGVPVSRIIERSIEWTLNGATEEQTVIEKLDTIQSLLEKLQK